MLDRVVDLREDVIAYLEKDGVKYTEKIVDMIVDEFGENIEDYEKRKNYTVGRTSIAYEKLLVRAIKEVFHRDNFYIISFAWAFCVSSPLLFACVVGLRQMHLSNESPLDVMIEKFKKNISRYIVLELKIALRILVFIACTMENRCNSYSNQ